MSYLSKFSDVPAGCNTKRRESSQPKLKILGGERFTRLLVLGYHRESFCNLPNFKPFIRIPLADISTARIVNSPHFIVNKFEHVQVGGPLAVSFKFNKFENVNGGGSCTVRSKLNKLELVWGQGQALYRGAGVMALYMERASSLTPFLEQNDRYN